MESNGSQDRRRPLPKGRPVALPKLPDAPRYSMDDLIAESGLSARTIRYYITEGMLPPAHGRGPSATYDREHLLRLRLIEEFKTDHLSLKEIKDRISDYSSDDIDRLFAVKSGPSKVLWRRIAITPEVELHVLEPSNDDLRFEEAVSQIVQYARFVLDQEADR